MRGSTNLENIILHFLNFTEQLLDLINNEQMKMGKESVFFFLHFYFLQLSHTSHVTDGLCCHRLNV